MAKRWGVDLEQALVHAQVARDLPDMSALWPAVYARPPESEVPDTEQALYSGFVAPGDRHRLGALRAMKSASLAQAPHRFAGPRPAAAGSGSISPAGKVSNAPPRRRCCAPFWITA